MTNHINLPKGSTYINRGIIKKDDDQGCFVVGNRLNFVIPKEITKQLYSLATGYYESGGLLFFELLKTPPRTLIAKDVVNINNISSNPRFEILHDRSTVKKIIIERARKRKLFLPAFFHIHPVNKEYSNIQYDFYRQAGPSQEDIACSFYTYPYLQDGKLSLPEFVICKHPSENWIFIGYYDSTRHEAIDAQRMYFQQELGLGLIKEVTPTLHSIKKEIKNMSLFEIATYLGIGYIAYKSYKPQINDLLNKIGEMVSAEIDLKIIETQIAAFGQVPFYTITRPMDNCTIFLPKKSYLITIVKMASQHRVKKRAFKELKKLMR